MYLYPYTYFGGFPGGSDIKEFAYNANYFAYSANAGQETQI